MKDKKLEKEDNQKEKFSPLNQAIEERIDTNELSAEQEDELAEDSETPNEPIQTDNTQEDEYLANEDFEDEDFDIEDLEDEDEENLNTETGKMPVDSKLTDLGADFVVNGAFKFLPIASCTLSKFDTKKSLELELSGDLDEGTTEHFKEINKENQERLASQLALVKPFVDEPLAKLAEVKALKFEPKTILIYIGIGLVLFLVYQTFSMRKSNKELFASLVAKRKAEKQIEANLKKVEAVVLEQEKSADIPQAAPKEIKIEPQKTAKDE